MMKKPLSDARNASLKCSDGVSLVADSTEEEIRKEVRRACETYGPGGHFIPCITYGAPGCLFPHVDPIMDDEIAKYNKEVYGI